MVLPSHMSSSFLPTKQPWIILGMGILSIVACMLGFVLETTYLIAAPIGILFIWLLLTNFKKVWYLLVFFIPLSVETELGTSLATDLPTEPIIVLLMLTYSFYILFRPKEVSLTFIKHPLSLILFMHLLWIAVTVIYATEILVAFKFLVAKIWYIITFFMLTQLIIKDKADIKKYVWCLFLPGLFIVVQTLIRHWQYDFSFYSVNFCVTPFFRNHVNYAGFLVLFLPFIMLARTWYSKGTLIRILLSLSVVLFSLAVYFSYTRAAWIAFFVIIIGYFIIKYKLMLPALIATALGAVLFLNYILDDNRYLSYAPDYTKTIYHDKLNEHLESTYTFEDLSTAERFYRWVAALNMSKEEPLKGFGPGNFYFNYKKYTISNFTTYVSDNPERSGVHNYFLMTLIEQGYVGLGIFILLSACIFLYGQQVYHKLHQVEDKRIIMAVLLSMMAIYIMNLFSDLIETDKVGAFFFINLALIIIWDMKNSTPIKGNLHS